MVADAEAYAGDFLFNVEISKDRILVAGGCLLTVLRLAIHMRTIERAVEYLPEPHATFSPSQRLRIPKLRIRCVNAPWLK